MFKINIDKELSMTCLLLGMSIADVATHAVREFSELKGRFTGPAQWDRNITVNAVMANPITKHLSVPEEFKEQLDGIRGPVSIECFLNHLIRGYLQSHGYLRMGWVLNVNAVEEVEVEKEARQYQYKGERQGLLTVRIINKIEELGGSLPPSYSFADPLNYHEPLGLNCACGSPIGVNSHDLLRAKTMPVCMSCAAKARWDRTDSARRKSPRELVGGREQRLITQIVRCGAIPPATIDRPENGSWSFRIPVTCSCGSQTTASTKTLFRGEKQKDPRPIKCNSCKAAEKNH